MTITRLRESEEQVGTWNLKFQASCALRHFFLPSHVLINHNDLHRLILMGPNRLPLFGYVYTLFTTEFWVVPAIALCGFGYGDTHYLLSYFYYQFIIYCS
jgi:hypothetical protein